MSIERKPQHLATESFENNNEQKRTLRNYYRIKAENTWNFIG